MRTDEFYDRVIWTETWCGRGTPISPKKSLQNVVKAAEEALRNWGTFYAIQDEDYGFVDVPDDYAAADKTPLKSVAEGVRSWWNNYGSADDEFENEYRKIINWPKGPKGYDIGGYSDTSWAKDD